MSRDEMGAICIANYYKIYDEARISKLTDPENYTAVAKVARAFREYVVKVSGVRDLPEIPD